MAPLPAKRRKLSHEGPAIFLGTESLGQTSDEDGEPTSEEDDALKQKTPRRPKRTQNVDENAPYVGAQHNSSMFKLQCDEMLDEVRPNYQKRMKGVDDTLHRLNSLIQAIESRASLPIDEATKLFQKTHKIVVPFPDPKPAKDAAYKLGYEKPSRINIVGSYASKTMVKSDSVLSIDMVVIMPKTLFHDKDFLNYRYFYKRAFYIACIAAGIVSSAKEEFGLKFKYLNGNSLHPILVVTPKQSDVEIQIIPGAPETLFAESKLLPTKNSIRPKSEGDSNVNKLAPSPFYNASIRSDCTFDAYLKLLHVASKSSESFKDACILGRIWLRQRGFGSSVTTGGFGHFEWAALTALLLKGGGPKGRSALSSGYSSYQMFKAVVQYLATSNLISHPQSYESSDFTPSRSDLPTFYDGPRGLNVLYKMTPWSYASLRDEAKVSIEMLNESTFDQFQSTFILRTSLPLYKFDCLVQVPTSSAVKTKISFDHISPINDLSHRMFEVLQEGLSDRVKLIDIQVGALPSWSFETPCPTVPDKKSILVGVVFEPNNIDRLVDHGPAAEEKAKAAKFQKFWGEKAELRRFKDGSILESLIWSPGSAHTIFEEIVTYLASRHFAPELSQGLSFTGQSFERSLPNPTSSGKNFTDLRQAFNTLEKDIRDLEGLPLQLKQLATVDPQLRNSAVEPPAFSARQPLKIPANVLIQFEGSGKWPDDVVAIQRTKIAFLLKIGSLLQEAEETIVTRLGLENEKQPLQNCAFLDIFYESGAVFRLRIHNDREKTLLERQIKESNDHRTREAAVSALGVYNSRCLQLPLHTQSIATHCTRFPLLSPTIRLVKKWFQSHLLLGEISEEFMELLAVRTFLHPFPWRAPSSAMTGLLRTLLFISRWDWRLVPLIVDFTGALSSKEVTSINTRLEAWRKIDSAMNRTVLFAASNHDPTGTAFTDSGPSKMIAARMTALARSACKLVRDQGLELNQRSLFTASTGEYDFLIHLASNTNSHKGSSKPKYKNLEVQSGTDLESVDKRPVELLVQELEDLYGDSIVFFYGASHASLIAGLWNPQLAAPRPFKLGLGYAIQASSSGSEQGEVKMDRDAILSEIARLGGDLISRIEARP